MLPMRTIKPMFYTCPPFALTSASLPFYSGNVTLSTRSIPDLRVSFETKAFSFTLTLSKSLK